MISSGEKSMKAINILAIGNSFSRDATAYLHAVCESMGFSTFVVNLYIGGCSLERHWSNVEKNERAYQYQENGMITDRYVSIAEILHSRSWDYIVTQQASHDSGWLETYEPFSGLLFGYLKKEAPEAQIVLQQTWAYEVNSDHDGFMRYNRDQHEMYQRSRKCYHTIAEKYGVSLIPCGDVIQNIRRHPEFDVIRGGISICRDGFHMHFLYGRYALACTWAKALLDAPVQDCPFLPGNCETEEVPEQQLLSLIRKVICDTVTGK